MESTGDPFCGPAGEKPILKSGSDTVQKSGGGTLGLAVGRSTGIPNAPSVYAPTVNPELALERQEQVESCMEQYVQEGREAA